LLLWKESILSFLPQLKAGLKQIQITLKRLIDTRWSAHCAAVKALHVDIDRIVKALLDEPCVEWKSWHTRGRSWHFRSDSIFHFISFL